MKLIRTALLIAVVAYASVLTYSLWYTPLTSHVPALRPFLPEPSSVTRSQPTDAVSVAGPALPVSTAPIVLSTPAPTQAPVAVVRWSASDCYFAGSMLLYDYGLDNSEWQAIADGDDTRYPKSDVAVYQAFAAEWWAALTDVRSMCKFRVPVAAAYLDRDMANFQHAIDGHRADAAADPANAAWDNEWVGHYQRVLAMYVALR